MSIESTTLFGMANVLNSQYQTYTAVPQTSDQEVDEENADSVQYVSISRLEKSANRITVERLYPKRFKKFIDCKDIVTSYKIATIATFPDSSIALSVSGMLQEDTPSEWGLELFLSENGKNIFLCKPNDIIFLNGKEYEYQLGFFKPFLKLVTDEINIQNVPVEKPKSFFQKIFKK